MTARKTNSELHERIKFIRKILKLSQDGLGKIADVSRVAVSQWESRDPDKRTEPNTERLKAIADATGFPYTWIIDDNSELKTPEGVTPYRAASPATPVNTKKMAPVIERIQQAADTIAELSPDGGSDEVLLSSLQILTAYRRVLQEANRKK